MKSLRNLYRIGHGPSSSHTMGPARAVEYLKNKYKGFTSVDVTLFGSFALTGRGHLTDKVIVDTFSPIPCKIKFDYKTPVEFPNTMDVILHYENKDDIVKTVKSIGGGAISISGEPNESEPEVYPQKNFTEICEFCKEKHMDLPQYVEYYEGVDIWDYLHKVWHTMSHTIEEGLTAEGLLPGKLKVQRRAKSFLVASHLKESSFSRSNRLIAAYAFATNEQNASGGIVVTAPTCGSSGTLPAVLMNMIDRYEFSDNKIVKALAVAGVIGNVVKQNGSISGAEAGCQAEVGTACAMAAAATSYLKDFNNDQIETAAEAALEHSLGLTCDPIQGYVQIPCIERNVIAASKALTATYLAEYATSSHRVTFDAIVETMLKTGHDMNSQYRETAEGGMAGVYNKYVNEYKKAKKEAKKGQKDGSKNI